MRVYYNRLNKKLSDLFDRNKLKTLWNPTYNSTSKIIWTDFPIFLFLT